MESKKCGLDFQNEKKSQATAQRVTWLTLTKAIPMGIGFWGNAFKFFSGFFDIKLQCK
jgi:hypothetical protein